MFDLGTTVVMTEGDIMGNEKMPKFTSRNGFVYMYNLDEKRWYKFGPTEELPLDVTKRVKEARELADILKDAI